jgi:hypothetical protein
MITLVLAQGLCGPCLARFVFLQWRCPTTSPALSWYTVPQ